ncbi:MAG: hypothetical protein VR68_04455 [Peptococcaceae bacterium BRH_c4a]|nr:MAG: hypothetical protein VR68_04455 [Peptococcaceae bacterium BRH_c4a]
MKKNIRKIALHILLTISVSLTAAAAAWAGEVKGAEITLEEAIGLALRNSKVIKQSDLDREKSRKNKNSAEIGYESTQASKSVPGTGYFIYDSATEGSHNAYLMASTDYEVKQRLYDVSKDGVALKAIEKYCAVLESIKKLDLAKVNQKRDSINYDLASLRYQLGIIAMQSFLQAGVQLDSSKSEVDNAEKTLITAYKAFNELVGLKQGERPVLKDEITFKGTEVEDIEAKISEILSVDPTLTNAKANEDLYRSLIGAYDSDGIKKIDADKNKISTEQLTEGKRELVRNLYNTLMSLEKGYLVAKKSLDLARESDRVTKLQYSVGLASKVDVVASEASLASAEQKLLNVKMQHVIMKNKFYKPWLAGN